MGDNERQDSTNQADGQGTGRADGNEEPQSTVEEEQGSTGAARADDVIIIK